MDVGVVGIEDGGGVERLDRVVEGVELIRDDAEISQREDIAGVELVRGEEGGASCLKPDPGSRP